MRNQLKFSLHLFQDYLQEPYPVHCVSDFLALSSIAAFNPPPTFPSMIDDGDDQSGGTVEGVMDML